MRLAAALLAICALAYACTRDDDLVPLGILAAVALVVLTIVTLQVREERAGWRTPSGPSRSRPGFDPCAQAANDNAGTGRQAS